MNNASILREIRTRLEVYKYMHNRSRKLYNTLNVGVLSLPVIILSAVTGASAFTNAFSNDCGNFNLDISMGVLECVCVILTSIQAYLKLGAKSKMHETTLHKCLDLIRQIDASDIENQSDINNVNKLYQSIIENSNNFTLHDIHAVMSKIKSTNPTFLRFENNKKKLILN